MTKKDMRQLLVEFRDSGQSEAVTMADLLQSAMFEDPDFSRDFAIAILDQFEEWAKYGKAQLRKFGPG
jgi:hypothetical protein